MSSYFTIQLAIKPGLQGFSWFFIAVPPDFWRNSSEFELTEVRDVKMPCVILGTAGQGLARKKGQGSEPQTLGWG